MTNGRSIKLLGLALTFSWVCGQVQQSQTTLEQTAHMASSSSQQQQSPSSSTPPALHIKTNNLKSPLLHSIFSKFESQPSNLSPQQATNVQRASFFQLFLDRLEARRSSDNQSMPFSDQLTLTLLDASSNTVSIEFVPNTATPEQQATWNSIVNLLADTLAYVINEAEQQGYIANFKYSMSLSDMPGFGFGTRLSPSALKSAAG